jgi:Tfp pilus assembly protein PilO
MTIIALLGILGTAYAAFALHRERVERLEERIATIEREYQLKEVQRVQYEAILQRLVLIEDALRGPK